MKKIISLCLGFGMFYWCDISVAGTCTKIIPQTSTVSFSNVIIQRDTPVGTIVSSKGSQSTGAYLDGCSNPFTLRFSMKYQGGNLSSLSDHVYDTNIPGLGIRFSSGSYFDNPPTVFDFTANSSYVSWWGGNVQLVVTGRVSSGILSSEVLGTIGVLKSDGVFEDGLTVNVIGGDIIAPACTVNTPTLNFNIGDVKASDFGTSVGTIPEGGAISQNLGLNCAAEANINVSLNGTQNPDVSTTTVLALTNQGSTGTAQGVGVQLIYNGEPLEINKNIVLKKSAGGQETFPLTARYYQTKNSVMPGKADSSATLNLTYQ